MKKKHLKLKDLKVQSFQVVDAKEVKAGLEREFDSAVNCDTDCIGRYCDPNILA